MKIERLFGIATILLNKGTITAKELADRFEVSIRTIYRDIEALSAAGVPIYTNKGNGGGISIIESYSLNRMLISERESEGILLALQTMQAVKYPEINMILEKLGALFKNDMLQEWIQIDFSPWGTGEEEKDKFNILRQAILQRRVVRFDYVGSGGQRNLRDVEPIMLQFKGMAWYLRGWCRYKNSIRTFRVTRMKKLVMTNETYIRKSIPEDKKAIDNNDPKALEYMVNLKLKFKAHAEYKVYDMYDENIIKRNEDGTLEVNVSYSEDEWVYGFLLSFGPDVEVLEPEHVRKILYERLKEAQEYYE